MEDNMGRGKGFISKKPDMGQRPNIGMLDAVSTTRGRLDQLLSEIQRLKLSPRCYGVLRRMAEMEPTHRLAISIKAALKRLADDPELPPSLRNSLTKDELSVLTELDGSSASLESRQAAHSLLCVAERIKFMQQFAKTFRDMSTRRNNKLEVRPLD